MLLNIQFSIILFIFCFNFIVTKIALLVDGNKNTLLQWIRAYVAMDHVTYALQSISEHAILFLQPNDLQFKFNKSSSALATSSTCYQRGVNCIRTIVKSGQVDSRNKLAQYVYQYEKNNNFEFKYWVFIDAKMLNVTCSAHTTGSVKQQAVGCLERFIHFLLARTSYSQIFLSNQYSKSNELLVKDTSCGSYYYHAIHRAAVPILLPYRKIIYSKSITYSISQPMVDSHASLLLISNICLGSNAITSSMLSYYDVMKLYHLQEFNASTVNDKLVYAEVSRLLKVNNIPLSFLQNYQSFPKICSDVKNTKPYTLGLQFTNTSSYWRKKFNYHKCLKSLKPNFLKFIETEN